MLEWLMLEWLSAQLWLRGQPITSTFNSPDGGAWHLLVGQFPYAGGNAWGRDQALASVDYWFREGLVVPEPSSTALMLLGCAAFVCLRRNGRS